MGEFFKGWRRKAGCVTLLVAWTQWVTVLIYPNWLVIAPLLMLSAYLFLIKPKPKDTPLPPPA